MRLLHAGHRDEPVRPVSRRPAGDPRRRQRCARRQSLPLHRLPTDRRRRARGLHAPPQDAFIAQAATPRQRSRRSTTARTSSSATSDAFSPRRRASRARDALRGASRRDARRRRDRCRARGSPSSCATLHKIDLARPRAGPRRIDETPEAALASARPSATCAPSARSAALDPDLGELMRRFGVVQVRAAGTVGGNIANGSPIGDLAPALIALGASSSCASGDGACAACRSRISSSPIASRTAPPASSSPRRRAETVGRRVHSAASRSRSASTRTSPR